MDQLEQAIEALIDPRVSNEIKIQANQYAESVKASPTGWQLCIELFLKQPKSSPHARLFALQTVDLMVNNRFRELSIEQALWLRDSLWNYVTLVYLVENENEPAYIRTKLATSLAVLFRRLYLQHWRNFYDDLIATLKVENRDKSTDFFLRVILAIDEEVVNTTTFRGKEEILLNTDLKDYMRERDLNNLVPIWNQIIVAYQGSNPEFSSLGLKIMGAFADWIDINLVVTESFMSILFQLVRSTKQEIGNLALRTAACDCLNQIVSKGMLPPEKMKLLQLFKIVETLPSLPLDDLDYIEHVAKLTNRVGLEFFMIWKNTELDSDLQVSAYNYLEALMPSILKFMSNEIDETSVTVFPIVNELINLLKHQITKFKRPLSDSQNAFFSELLKVTIQKFKYPEDFDWEELDEEDEEAHFGSIRKSLKQFFDTMPLLNKPLFDDLVHSVVTSTFTSHIDASSDWTRVELALRILFQYGATNNKTLTYLNDPNNPSSVNHLGDMVLKMVENNVLACSHPSLAPAYYENCIRYYQLFEVRPDLIPAVFTCFLDKRGIYHDLLPVRRRVWYLFLRFIKLLKGHAARFVQDIIPTLQGALVIGAEIPEDFKPDTPLTQLKSVAPTFESQLYLFESVSTLLAYANTLTNDQKVQVLQMVLTPLINIIQSGTNQAKQGIPEDPLFIIQLHHCIMAVGSVSKGLPESKKENDMYPWSSLLKQSTEIILQLLQLTGQFQMIRDAAMFTFARLLSSVGADILPLLVLLIQGLMSACEPAELLELLPFIGLALHRFSEKMFPIMNEMLGPLLNKAFVFLNQTPSGTDELFLINNLRKAYVSFLASLFGAKLEGVLCTDLNQGNLSNVLASLIHFGKDNTNPQIQKLSFNIQLKMIHSWLAPQTEADLSSQISPQFRKGFLEYAFQQIIPTSFHVPMVRTFDLDDGQSLLIFGEITSLHQAVYKAVGPPFLEYLQVQFLPSIQCPPAQQQELISAIQQLEPKAYRKFFQSFIGQSRNWVL